MNAQGDAQTGLVLTRNEIWLLLHALAETTAPTLRWSVPVGAAGRSC